MATLHIEHPITDFSTWKRAFDSFSDARTRAGVTAHRLHQPPEDPRYIVIQLDFPSVAQAEGFKTFLETKVWSSPDKSPGLAGVPRARVLVDAPA